MFILSRIFFENPTRFQTKTTQNPTRWGGTYLYGVPSPALKLGSEARRFSPVFRGVSGVVAVTVDGYF